MNDSGDRGHKVHRYAFATRVGQAFIASHADLIFVLAREASRWSLRALSERGEHRWTRELKRHDELDLTRVPQAVVMRVSSEGHAWILDRTELLVFQADGELINRHQIPATEDYIAESFLLLPDGYIALAVHSSRGAAVAPKLIRVTLEGEIAWKAKLPALVEIDAEEERSTWDCYFVRDPLLASSRRVLAGLATNSGKGCYYAVDRATGELSWITPIKPMGFCCLLDEEHFLIGSQGYGVFESSLHNAQGEVVDSWMSHGHVVVGEDRRARIVEMENVLPSRSSFGELVPGGKLRRAVRVPSKIRKAFHLPNYYTADPAITKDGTVFFWRAGVLSAVDGEMRRRTILETPELSESMLTSRIIITRSGSLVFRLENEIILVELNQTPAKSVWPCGLGNAKGNPVV